MKGKSGGDGEEAGRQWGVVIGCYWSESLGKREGEHEQYLAAMEESAVIIVHYL